MKYLLYNLFHDEPTLRPLEASNRERVLYRSYSKIVKKCSYAEKVGCCRRALADGVAGARGNENSMPAAGKTLGSRRLDELFICGAIDIHHRSILLSRLRGKGTTSH